MASCQNNNTSTTSSRGYIYDTIVKIDQMQKAANMETACEGCEGSLVYAFYNTKPVSFYLRSGAILSVIVPESTSTTALNTTYFRIEQVKSDAVILRLLVQGMDNEFTCTNYTVVLNMDCICSLQCFQPICCPECSRPCPQN